MTSDISQFKYNKALAMHNFLANEVGGFMGIIGAQYLVWTRYSDAWSYGMWVKAEAQKDEALEITYYEPEPEERQKDGLIIPRN